MPADLRRSEGVVLSIVGSSVEPNSANADLMSSTSDRCRLAEVLPAALRAAGDHARGDAPAAHEILRTVLIPCESAPTKAALSDLAGFSLRHRNRWFAYFVGDGEVQ